MFKITLGFLAALWLSGCSGLSASTVISADVTDTQTPVVETQTIVAATRLIQTPTMTRTPLQNKTATQPPPPSATATPALPVALGTPFPTPDAPIASENVSRLRQLAVFGSPAIYEAVLSADGKRLFLAESDGTEIYNTATGALAGALDLIVQEYPSHGDLAVSADGSTLLGITRSGIQIADAKDGQVLWQYAHGLSYYGSAALSPDGRLAAIADCAELEECAFQVFRIADEQLVFSGKGRRPFFSPDGRWFAADVGRSIWIWDMADWSKAQYFWLENPTETRRAFSPDGNLLAVGRSDKVEIWRIVERKRIRVIGGLEAVEYDGLPLIFSPDSTQIAIQDGSRKWLVYDIQSGRLLQSIELSPSSIIYWDENQLKSYPLPERPNYFPAWNGKAFRFVDQDSALVFPSFQANGDGTVRSETCRLSLAGGLLCVSEEESRSGIDVNPLANRIGSRRPIQVMGALQDGAYLIYDASVKFDPQAGLWDAQQRRVRIWKGALTQWSASKDERCVAVGVRDNGVYHIDVIDLASGKSIFSRDFKTYWLVLDLSPDGNLLAVVMDMGETDQLQLIDLTTRKAVNAIEFPKPVGDGVFISAVEFGSVGDMLAFAFSDGRIEIYNPDGKLLHIWQAHQGEIAMVFSKDGRLLATSSRDGLIKIWGIYP